MQEEAGETNPIADQSALKVPSSTKRSVVPLDQPPHQWLENLCKARLTPNCTYVYVYPGL